MVNPAAGSIHAPTTPTSPRRPAAIIRNGALVPDAISLVVLAIAFALITTMGNAGGRTSTTSVLVMGALSTSARFASWSATARTSQASARSKVAEEAPHRDAEMTEHGAAIVDVVVMIADVVVMIADAAATRVATRAVAGATLDAAAAAGETRM